MSRPLYREDDLYDTIECYQHCRRYITARALKHEQRRHTLRSQHDDRIWRDFLDEQRMHQAMLEARRRAQADEQHQRDHDPRFDDERMRAAHEHAESMLAGRSHTERRRSEISHVYDDRTHGTLPYETHAYRDRTYDNVRDEYGRYEDTVCANVEYGARPYGDGSHVIGAYDDRKHNDHIYDKARYHDEQTREVQHHYTLYQYPVSTEERHHDDRKYNNHVHDKNRYDDEQTREVQYPHTLYQYPVPTEDRHHHSPELRSRHVHFTTLAQSAPSTHYDWLDPAVGEARPQYLSRVKRSGDGSRAPLTTQQSKQRWWREEGRLRPHPGERLAKYLREMGKLQIEKESTSKRRWEACEGRYVPFKGESRKAYLRRVKGECGREAAKRRWTVYCR